MSLTGIVIGVAAVILVLSLGAGLRQFVMGQVESFGTDIIEIEVKTPKTEQVSSENASSQVGGLQITTFKIKDAEKVAEKIPNVEAWYAGVLGQEVIEAGGENETAFLFGVTSGVAEADTNFILSAGNMFTNEDDKSLRQSVILGSKMAEKLFNGEDAVGQNIKIKGKRYRVDGVLKGRGGAGFFDFDDLVYVPVRTLQKKIMGIDHIIFAIYKMKDMSRAELDILTAEEVMRDQHDIDDPEDDDFAVISMTEATEMLDTIFTVINILLVGLTSVSLLVGGVGIMNVMYVSVTERTPEIGLRKSVGAENSDILRQFLFEAVFITLIGGLAGVIIGFGISQIAEFLAASRGFYVEFPITWQSVLIGFGFSVLTGLLFGIYPAKKASRLSPIEALRKE